MEIYKTRYAVCIQEGPDKQYSRNKGRKEIRLIFLFVNIFGALKADKCDHIEKRDSDIKVISDKRYRSHIKCVIKLHCRHNVIEFKHLPYDIHSHGQIGSRKEDPSDINKRKSKQNPDKLGDLLQMIP